MVEIDEVPESVRIINLIVRHGAFDCRIQRENSTGKHFPCVSGIEVTALHQEADLLEEIHYIQP